MNTFISFHSIMHQKNGPNIQLPKYFDIVYIIYIDLRLFID